MTLLLGCTLDSGSSSPCRRLCGPSGRRQENRSGGGLVVPSARSSAQAGLHSVTVPLLAVVSAIVAVACAAVTLAVVPVTALGAGGRADRPGATDHGSHPGERGAAGSKPGELAGRPRPPGFAVRGGLSLPDSVSTLAHIGPEATRADFATFERRGCTCRHPRVRGRGSGRPRRSRGRSSRRGTARRPMAALPRPLERRRRARAPPDGR